MKTKPDNQLKTCPSCGAPIVSEICAYCGTATGLNTEKANMDYPVLECKEVVMNFWTIWFPCIFAVAFGIPSIVLIIITALGFGNSITLLMSIPFMLVSFIASFFILRTLIRYMKVKAHGKTIDGIVYGYLDDSVMFNNKPAQIVKLLVQTPNGPRFILYQLGGTLKPYGINEKIKIRVYQNCFMILKNTEIIEW